MGDFFTETLDIFEGHCGLGGCLNTNLRRYMIGTGCPAGLAYGESHKTYLQVYCTFLKLVYCTTSALSNMVKHCVICSCNMDPHIIPKLEGKVTDRYGSSFHVVVIGQQARHIYPSFDELLHYNFNHFQSEDWREVAASICSTGTYALHGHAVLAVEPYVIDQSTDDAPVLHPFHEVEPIAIVDVTYCDAESEVAGSHLQLVAT